MDQKRFQTSKPFCLFILAFSFLGYPQLIQAEEKVALKNETKTFRSPLISPEAKSAPLLNHPLGIINQPSENKEVELIRNQLELMKESLDVMKKELLLIHSNLGNHEFQKVNQHSTRQREEGFRALYTMNRDGSNVQYLVTAPKQISSATPEWSHNGLMIAFDSVDVLQNFQRSKLFVYAVGGPFKGMFKDLGYGNVPSWSPDDSQITFMINSGNPKNQQAGIWVMNSDGTDRKWICTGWYPRWSPDGSEICFHAYFKNPQQIHFYNVKTGAIRKILGSPMAAKFGGGTWSPDGNSIVFIGIKDGKEHLSVIHKSGSPKTLKILYRENNSERELVGPPSWSPDGKQIVFARQEPGKTGSQNRIWHHTYLYSISAEVPSAPILLEKEKIGLINRGMMWSPDSQKIIFSSER